MSQRAQRAVPMLLLIAGLSMGGLVGWTVGRAAQAGESPVPGAAPNPFPSTASGHADAESARTVALAGVNTAERFVSALGAALSVPVHVHWEHTELRPDTPLRFDIPAADVATCFRLINSQRAFMDPLDYRVYPDHAEVGGMLYFDKQEVVTVNYDLAGTVRALQAAADPSSPAATADQVVRAIVDTIETNVASDYWTDNGGELGRINIIGSGLLVSAPKRFQPQVAWVLAQVERTPGWSTGLQRLFGPGRAAAVPGGPSGVAGSAPPGGAPAAGTGQGNPSGRP